MSAAAKFTVLQLIGSFDQGGSERQAIQLTRLLQEDGAFRVKLACLDPKGPLRAEAEQIGTGEIPAFELTSFSNATALRAWTRFVQYLRAEKIHLIQTHDFYTNVFGMIGGAMGRLPARVAARREIGGMRTRSQQWVERQIYRLAHAIVANADAVRQEVLREGIPASKVVTIYNGLDLQRLSLPATWNPAAELARLQLPVGRRFIAIVANMNHEVKDHTTFLAAAQLIHQQFPDTAFLLAGEGCLLERFREQAAALGIGDSTFFLGRCTRVAELLALSSICVLSSRFEGFSNSILEYMAAARPVVATSVGGAAEAIVEGETGYLIAAGDYKALAQRVGSLLLNPQKAMEMGEAGHRRVSALFSCEAQLESTKALYRRLLDIRVSQPSLPHLAI
jgi:glycosyltransferase involved in cell wall biosynthesis